MTEIPTSTRAVVLEAPGPPEALQIRDVPVPVPEPGQVLIKVEAFGTNRSELHTRLGLADGVTFPRCPRHRSRRRLRSGPQACVVAEHPAGSASMSVRSARDILIARSSCDRSAHSCWSRRIGGVA